MRMVVLACSVRMAEAFTMIEVARDGYGDLLYVRLLTMLGVS